MSRIANSPVELPSGVEANIANGLISIKGSQGALELSLHEKIDIVNEDNQLKLKAKSNEKSAVALAGTFRSLVNNMVIGVSQGFEKKLTLIGVGYRAKVQGNILNLIVGYSHPIDYSLPDGVTAETPSQTEIIIKGADKQLVGQVAAEIRKFRPPEPYKGKGIRYNDEHVYRKEAKKK
ncbi:MAG: 50S ribosomal protein L6 [SAR86 cluster bacterium]|uniref:Large ribosomal subunit protein uL6 n=1 Tax=SAR86 cluster bacterium TaxID=2030880 RepID=A0A2A5CH62_9GAMM|nr:MAG: 50S ribosomal protein L6 [SAR86 cluster bacterium]